jgi:ApbE superfamily uncharacterized protein (UPF0280 family)
VQIQKRSLVLLLLGSLILGLGIGVFGKPARIETHTVTQDHVVYQDKVVTVEAKAKEAEADKQKVVYVDRVVHRDGSSETKTSIQYVDRVVIKSEATKSRTEMTDAVRDTKHTFDHVVTNQPRWTVAVGAAAVPSLNPLGVSPLYMAMVTCRIAGPVSVGVFGTFTQASLQPSVGALVSVSF